MYLLAVHVNPPPALMGSCIYISADLAKQIRASYRDPDIMRMLNIYKYKTIINNTNWWGPMRLPCRTPYSTLSNLSSYGLSVCE